MKVLEIKKDRAGQWMYRGPGYDWQYGSFEKNETITQATGRFGRYDKVVEVG